MAGKLPQLIYPPLAGRRSHINVDMKTLVSEIHRSLDAMTKKNAPSFRLVRREWSKRLKHSPATSVIALAKQLVPLGFWERIFAYEIIVNHQPALHALSQKDVASLGQGIQSWGEVDCFSCYIAGPAWRQRNISDQLIKSWAQSPNHWWRRAALVSTVPLNNRARGGQGDVNRTLKICRMLIRDRDDMVIKALSWALRELSKRYPVPVSSFLEQYDEHLAPRVKREVTNKLRTGLKNPRRVSDS
jgi:3-methyladenine DNA glycosylase AlkD